MISICLPVYNLDVRNLVQQLDRQCRLHLDTYEIIALDDGSEEKYVRMNSQIHSEGRIRYEMNEKNLGRAATRNKLGHLARYEWLLFIDGDSLLCTDNFISYYLKHIPQDGVIYGGTRYADSTDTDYALHRAYGKKAEALSLSHRNARPYLSFRTNNFLISKALLMRIPFDESLKRYGHEDSLIAAHWQMESIPIRHIDNPVLHTGLFKNSEFVKRSREATEHLADLESEGKLIAFTKLQKWNHLVYRWPWKKIVAMYLQRRKERYRFDALEKGSLTSLSLYKWAVYLGYKKRKAR